MSPLERVRGISSGTLIYAGGLVFLCVVGGLIAWGVAGGGTGTVGAADPPGRSENADRSTASTETPGLNRPDTLTHENDRNENGGVESTAEQRHQTQIAKGPPVGHESAKTNITRPWRKVIVLSERDLDEYFVLRGIGKLISPRDFQREAEESGTALQRAMRRWEGMKDELYDGDQWRVSAEDFVTEAGMDNPAGTIDRERPSDDLEALDRFVSYMQDYQSSLMQFTSKLEPDHTSYRRLAAAFAKYPIAREIERAISGHNDTVNGGTTISPLDQTTEFALVEKAIDVIQLAHAHGRTLHERRVRLFTEELYTEMKSLDEGLAAMQRAIARANQALPTFSYHRTEYTTEVPPAIALRMRHAYAVSCDNLMGLTASKWNWPRRAIPLVESNFDYWYQWATDADWYSGTRLALDPAEYPKDSQEARALYDEFKRLAREEPERFLSAAQVKAFKAPDPPRRK